MFLPEDTNSRRKGFSLNWSYSENCDPDPTPEPGVSTFMGMATSSHSGYGLEWPKDEVHALKAAIDIMREHGYRCETPPKGWEPEGEALEEGKKEFQYLHLCYEPIEVMGKANDKVEFELEFQFGWLYITCNSTEARDFVEEHIDGSPHYQLGLIEHEESRYDFGTSSSPYTLVRRTGRGGKKAGVGTLFELRRGPMTIAKALCSYRNLEMNNSGPTIELFEVEGTMRRKGYGKLLFLEMTAYFQEVFLEQCEFIEPIKFNVCYCTNRYAFEWFMRQGFEDWDGMGEELGKYLDE